MLSYQHEYHAGNHADVLKHTCLVAILDALLQKEKPFTVIESHAGAGRFCLDDERLERTGEARGGVLRLAGQCGSGAAVPHAVSRYLALEEPYLSRGLYAGSVELERVLLRAGDAHAVCERHPRSYEALRVACTLPVLEQAASGCHERRAGAKTTVLQQDGYASLNALTPPLIRRGLVLIDPSYEDASDYADVARAARTVRKKWGTAVIAVWYPLLARRKNERAHMLSALELCAKTGTQPAGCFYTELTVADPQQMAAPAQAHLYGSGMFVINPPWKLQEQMAAATAFLADALRG